MVNRSTWKNRFHLEIDFAGFLHGEKPEKNYVCLNIHILFNTSSAPSDQSLGDSDECINCDSDIRKSYQTKGDRQSWSCSMEYSFFVYIYRAPSLNNAIYTIRMSQALITTTKGHQKWKIVCVDFISLTLVLGLADIIIYVYVVKLCWLNREIW